MFAPVITGQDMPSRSESTNADLALWLCPKWVQNLLETILGPFRGKSVKHLLRCKHAMRTSVHYKKENPLGRKHKTRGGEN